MNQYALEEKIKAHLKQKDLTQAQAARKLHYTPEQFNKWIRGVIRMPDTVIQEVSDLLDLTDEERGELFSLGGYVAIDMSSKKSSKDQRVEIHLRGDFSSLSAERKNDVIDVFAVLFKIKRQNIEIYEVRPGSIVFDLGLPVEAVQRLRSLLQANSEQLHRLRIEKILLGKESAEPETWAIENGRFYHVNLTQTTTVSVGNTTIRNVVILGDQKHSGLPGQILTGDSVSKTPQKQKITNKPKTSSKPKNGMIKAIIVAVGAAGLLVGCILLAAVAWYAGLFDQIPGFGSSKPVTITVQVTAEVDGTIIPRAQAILFADGERYIKPTDTTGTATFTDTTRGRANLSLIVEAQGYQIYSLDNLSRPSDGLIKALLRPQTGEQANVLILASNEKEEPISGAEVVLLVEGQVFPQITDSNGVAKFPLTFKADAMEAQMQIKGVGLETEYQNVTLLPNQVIGVRLDSQDGSLTQISVTAPQSDSSGETPTADSGMQLDPETILSDNLAQGEVKNYKFAGVTNTPMLFTIEVPEGDMIYQMTILDATANEVTKPAEYHPGLFSAHRKVAIPFTPKAGGEYTLRLEGIEYYANYTVRLDQQ